MILLFIMRFESIPSNYISDIIFYYLTQFLIFIGKYGAIILFLTTIIFFFRTNRQNLLMVYIFCFFINYIFNIICKIILKQPRPKENLDLFPIVRKNATFLNWNYFGTPSTNVQSEIYTTTYISLTMRNPWFTIPFLIITLNTMIQQYILSETYYAYQIIVGFILGIIIGYLAYIISTTLSKGDLAEKPDDYAPEIRGLL